MMNKRIDNDVTSVQNNLPLNIETQRGSLHRKYTSRIRNNRNTKFNTSLQDIRELAATLYLTEIPGLGGIEKDRDILIDEYYSPIYISD